MIEWAKENFAQPTVTDAHTFLTNKGIKSMGELITAHTVEQYLNEFLREYIVPTPTDTEIEQLAFKEWEKEIKDAEEHSVSVEEREYFYKGFKAALNFKQ